MATRKAHFGFGQQSIVSLWIQVLYKSESCKDTKMIFEHQEACTNGADFNLLRVFVGFFSSHYYIDLSSCRYLNSLSGTLAPYIMHKRSRDNYYQFFTEPGEPLCRRIEVLPSATRPFHSPIAASS